MSEGTMGYDILAEAEAVVAAAESRYFFEQWDRAHRRRDVFAHLLLAAGVVALAVGAVALLLLTGWLVGALVSVATA